MELSPLQHEILCHRLSKEDEIIKRLSADYDGYFDPNMVSLYCRRLRLGEFIECISDNRERTRAILYEAVARNTYCSEVPSTVSPAKLKGIQRSARILGKKVSRFIGLKVETPLS